MTHRAVIAPIADGEPRPRWSVMIPSYRDGDRLRAALDSVLAQDPGPDVMQIEVVDDASPQDPTPLVRELAGDRVALHRQPRNVGHVANFNTCLQRSRGELVHLLHGDDAVRPGFYEALEPAFADPSVGAAFCRYIAMDEHGHWLLVSDLEAAAAGVVEDWLSRIAAGQRIQPPAMTTRRAIYETVGGFDRRLTSYGEDWEMWVRIAAETRVWFEPEPLALYRVGSGSLSANSLRTGDNMRQLRWVIEHNRQRLPADIAGPACRTATRDAALAALRRAHRMANAGDRRGAWAQLREAVRTSRTPAVSARAVKLAARLTRP